MNDPQIQETLYLFNGVGFKKDQWADGRVNDSDVNGSVNFRNDGLLGNTCSGLIYRTEPHNREMGFRGQMTNAFGVFYPTFHFFRLSEGIQFVYMYDREDVEDPGTCDLVLEEVKDDSVFFMRGSFDDPISGHGLIRFAITPIKKDFFIPKPIIVDSTTVT